MVERRIITGKHSLPTYLHTMFTPHLDLQGKFLPVIFFSPPTSNLPLLMHKITPWQTQFPRSFCFTQFRAVVLFFFIYFFYFFFVTLPSNLPLIMHNYNFSSFHPYTRWILIIVTYSVFLQFLHFR